MAILDIFKRAEPEEITEEAEDKEFDAIVRGKVEGTYVTKSMAMQIPAFGASVDMISGIVASIPIRLYKRDGDQIAEIADDPRVKMLNTDTGDTLTAPEMKKAMVEDYFTGKGGFAYINRVGNRVESLHYVKESDITPLMNEDPIFKHVKYMVGGGTYEDFDFIRILRATKDGRKGENLVDQNQAVLSVAFATMKFEHTLVKRGGNKRGFIKSAKKLGETALKALRKAWSTFYADSNENVVILNDGIEFQEASNTSVEMQLNENKETNSNDISMLFKMSPKIIRGGADENDRDNFTRYGLMTILAEFRAALNRSLLLETEKDSYFFDFDISEFTKANMKDRWDAWANAKRNGLVMPDEFRKSENLPPLGIKYVNMGLQDVLMDPKADKVIVPNMGTVIDLNNLPANASGNKPPTIEGGETNEGGNS